MSRSLQYLGLDPDVDKALMWIAVEGLSAPLPDNWSEHVDENGNLIKNKTKLIEVDE